MQIKPLIPDMLKWKLLFDIKAQKKVNFVVGEWQRFSVVSFITFRGGNMKNFITSNKKSFLITN